VEHGTAVGIMVKQNIPLGLRGIKHVCPVYIPVALLIQLQWLNILDIIF